MDNFENSVGFITGGAGGIGLGVARALGQRGMTVILADVEENTLDAAAQVLESEGITALTEVLDVRNLEAYEEVAARTLRDHGKLNFLFNNAGVTGPSPLGSSRMEDWR